MNRKNLKSFDVSDPKLKFSKKTQITKPEAFPINCTTRIQSYTFCITALKERKYLFFSPLKKTSGIFPLYTQTLIQQSKESPLNCCYLKTEQQTFQQKKQTFKNDRKYLRNSFLFVYCPFFSLPKDSRWPLLLHLHKEEYEMLWT
jgi:hypothetical protein